jgi:hypothetical protein
VVPDGRDPDGPAVHRNGPPAPPRGRGAADDDLSSAVPEFRPSGEPYPAALRPLDPTGEIRASRRTPRPEQLWLDVTWDEPQLREPTDDDDDDATGPWPVSEAS